MFLNCGIYFISGNSIGSINGSWESLKNLHPRVFHVASKACSDTTFLPRFDLRLVKSSH